MVGQESGPDSPAQIALGWLKIKHTRNSYGVWSDYRVRCKLAEGREPCPANKQHRAFGVRHFWGGYEYWGWPPRKDEEPEALEELGTVDCYRLELPPDELERLRAQGLDVRSPDGDSVMTEWGDDALVILGHYLHEAGTSLLAVLGELVQAGAQVRRLDISGDFPAAVIDPVVSAQESRDYLPQRVHDFRDSRGQGPNGGRTCYFGKRGDDGGGVFVRFYEKGRELGLPIDLLRYEVELTGDKAHHAAKLLADSPQAWWPTGASILAGAIDFRQGYGARRGEAHAARDCPQHTWWAALLGRLNAAIRLERVKRPDATLITIREWAESSWPRALAILQTWLGPVAFDSLMRQLLENGRDRMTERDLALVRSASTCEVPF